MSLRSVTSSAQRQ
jgi:hypothetical protein